jgi:hypothetical protein
MCRVSPRVRAGVVLAVTLLPLCAFASPLRLQLAHFDSAITDTPELSAQTLQERTTYGLTQALPLAQGKATLVSAGEPEGAELVVAGKMERNGAKFRLVYILQTKQAPKLQKQLAYEFATPRLSDRGVTVMAQELIAEAVKLEEARKAQAAMQPAPEVASAPVSTPAVEASSEPMEDSTPDETSEVSKERMQPLFVVHSGVAGLWGYGTQSFGLGGVVEPKWNITDWLSVGLRVDGSVLFGGRFVPQGSVSVALGASVAKLVKAELLLGNTGVRPFVGLGAGAYTLLSQSVSAGNSGAGVSQAVGEFFGVAPQLGLDFGGARLGVTYNHMLRADIVIEQNIALGIQAERIPRNYVQLELTFRGLQFGIPKKTVVPDRY